MAFDVIHKAAMQKFAVLGRSTLPGTERLPEAAPGTSYIPKDQQRIQNMGNYIKTKLNDYGGNVIRSAAKTVLPGKMYDIARDTWHEFNDDSPVDRVMNYVDKGLRSDTTKDALKAILPEKAYNYVREMGKGGIKPTKRVTRWKDAIHADKYVNPDTVEELSFAPNTMAERLWTEDQYRKENAKWKARPDSRNYETLSMPEGNKLMAVALKEAKSPEYNYLRYGGWTDEQIAQMLLKNYYIPAFRDVTGAADVNEFTQATPDQWDRYWDLQADRVLGNWNRNNKRVGFGQDEASQDAARANILSAMRGVFDQAPGTYKADTTNVF
jgi:hypothetical protein